MKLKILYFYSAKKIKHLLQQFIVTIYCILKYCAIYLKCVDLYSFDIYKAYEY